ncbi:MAG: homocysteine S-methyltransferase family protein [Actinomycetota bacterium]
MSAYRRSLPQLDAALFLTDGGIETTMIFDEGFDLPHFAAFPLLDFAEGRAALHRYFDSYVEIAVRDEVGIVLETPTWRASSDWGALLGYDHAALEAINRDAVALTLEQRRQHERPSTPVVISGCIGPRADGYRVTDSMSANEARSYHGAQVNAFADTDADLVSALTLNYVQEAVGIAQAARAAGMPVVLSFTVETDGRLATGAPLGEAIDAVDHQTDGYPAYYMVNCAHPTHFSQVIDGASGWASRIHGVRANSSTRSHAELDEAEHLDRGSATDLAARYLQLRDILPNLCVVGGCCGTDHRHVDAISTALSAASAP